MAEFATPGSLPSMSDILIDDDGGALMACGAYPTAAAWLASQYIDPASDGALALTADEPAIDMTGYDWLAIAAAGNMTFDGAVTPASGCYTFGGGPGLLTVATTLSGDNSVLLRGNVALSGVNTCSGGMDIDNGTVQLAGAAALGSGSVIVNGTLDLDGYNAAMDGLSGSGIVETSSGDATLAVGASGEASTFSGTLQSGGGGGQITLVVTGGGAFSLSGAGGFSGAIAIDPSSTLIVGDGGLTSETVTDNGVLAFDASQSQTFSGAIGGTGSVSMIGSGAMELAGGNSYSGGTQIVSGMLAFDAAGALPANGQVAIDSGGALEAAGPWTTAADWLAYGPIDPDSTARWPWRPTRPAQSISAASDQFPSARRPPALSGTEGSLPTTTPICSAAGRAASRSPPRWRARTPWSSAAT